MPRVETGACFCGAIAATMDGEPFWICYDHDDDCRRAIGSPLTVWVGYRPSQLNLSRGTPKAFSKTPGVIRTFCPDCGSSIGYSDEGLPDELYLTIGFFDKPEGLRPQAHAYWDLRLPWVDFADKLPRIERYSRKRDAKFGNPRDR
ncbi:GFA family protein [Mesorhizobium australicum]|uniref:GFA family protein n=1 Tax=Mesorhizobium australicum TaxID=536018 RepID=UPI003335D7FD